MTIKYFIDFLVFIIRVCLMDLLNDGISINDKDVYVSTE